MNCENRFCIYCNSAKCTLNEINIDSMGMCGACIIIDLDDDILKPVKRKILEQCEKDYNHS